MADEQKRYPYAPEIFFQKLMDYLVQRGNDEWSHDVPLNISSTLTGTDASDSAKKNFLVELKAIYMFLVGKIVTKITNYDDEFDPKNPTLNDDKIKIPTVKTVYDFVQMMTTNLKQELNSLEFTVVEELPETGETRYIYLVPQDNSDIHDVYYWISDNSGGHFEPMGNTKINLSDYATIQQLNDSVDGLINMIEEVEENIENLTDKFSDINDSVERLNDERNITLTGDVDGQATFKNTENIEIEVTIKPDFNELIIPSQVNDLIYDGETKSPEWDSYTSKKMDISGSVLETNAGNYKVTFTPKKGYIWADGSNDSKTVQWIINRATIESIPSQNNSLTYTGSTLYPTWDNYDETKMTIDGATSGINATSYNVTFTPKENYQWSGGSIDAKTVLWNIQKAAGSFTLSSQNVTLSVSSMTYNVIVNRTGNGTIYAQSSDPSMASVSVSGTTITITGKGKGSTSVSVYIGEGTNHNATSTKTITVTSNIPSSTLNNNTPADIKAAVQAGIASSLWDEGDRVLITLNGNVEDVNFNNVGYYAFVIGFDHNKSVESNNKPNVCFQFGKNTSNNYITFRSRNYSMGGQTSGFIMNPTNSNSGGWSKSYMRNTVCSAFLSIMPTEWQNIITNCTKYTDNSGGGSNVSSNVTTTSDKIWILSEREIFVRRNYANSTEETYQKQYTFYENGNTRIMGAHDTPAYGINWWLRSPDVTNTSNFCHVSGSGVITTSNANQTLGFSPCFMVA